jgi:hypothetical protein
MLLYPHPPSSARVKQYVPYPFEACYDQPDLGVSFNGKLSPNFDLKNMISTFTKDFFMENMTQIRQILKICFSNHQIFTISAGR